MRSETDEAVPRSQRPSGGSRTPLLNAYGGPNHERSSPPLLTVLLLLTEEQQEEGEGASEREDGTSGVWAPQGSFFGLSVGDIWETWLQQGITETPLPVPYRRTERINSR